MKFPSTICVCGAGTMGSGIAQVFATYDFDVTLYDVDTESLARAGATIESNLNQAVARGKLETKKKYEIINRIRSTSNVHECIADVIIEAVVENAEVKVKLLNDLFSVNSSNTIIASNTSSLSINELSGKLIKPHRFAGMHFFNPATLMKLVEIVATPALASGVVKTLCDIAGRIGKTAVVCNDSPGFIVNRVARPFYIEAMYLAEKYAVEPVVIDRLLENTGFKMGPFRLMDLIGNDVNYSVSTIVYEALNRPPHLKPAEMQRALVNRGLLGRKTGRGFYEY